MINNIIAGVAGLAAIASIVVALRTYREQVRSRQTEWLLDLHQRLLENERFRDLSGDMVRELSGAARNTPTVMTSAIKKRGRSIPLKPHA